MRKKTNILTTIALGAMLLPVFAHAESVATSTLPQTEAQVFTACSQAAIEVRDSSIGAARTTYNQSMAAALTARKEAEKEAVALADAGDKKEAIRAAVEEYKKAVSTAQDELTKSRKEAWSTFESNANSCRDTSKEARKGFITDKKASSTEKESGDRSDADETKNEIKSLKDVFIESLKNFFKKGAASN